VRHGRSVSVENLLTFLYANNSCGYRFLKVNPSRQIISSGDPFSAFVRDSLWVDSFINNERCKHADVKYGSS
jgi:hypothetical protein